MAGRKMTEAEFEAWRQNEMALVEEIELTGEEWLALFNEVMAERENRATE